MAFVRRKGNAFYLVHNVRQRGRVKQLHLASLGEQPRITRDVVRKVSRAHPLLALDWERLREDADSRIERFDPRSGFFQRLLQDLRSLHLDLADLSPAQVRVSRAPGTAEEVVRLMRFLRSTLKEKLGQFEQAGREIPSVARRYR